MYLITPSRLIPTFGEVLVLSFLLYHKFIIMSIFGQIIFFVSSIKGGLVLRNLLGADSEDQLNIGFIMIGGMQEI